MLTMRQKKAVTRELRDRYQRSSKKEKSIILNGFIQLTGYNRCYACQVLNVKKEKVLGYLNIAGKRIKYIADKRKIKRKKKKIYDQDVLVALKELWKICNHICSKRLAPFLFLNLPRFTGHQDKTIIKQLEVQIIWRKDNTPRNLRKRQLSTA